MKNYTNKIIVGIVISVITLISIASTNVIASKALVAKRLGGKDRVETSVKLSKDIADKNVKTAILVGYNGEIDALTGTSLTNKLQARIFMTKKDKLDTEVLAEIKRLEIEDIIILGGTSIISKELENEVKGLDFINNVKRLYGETRTETAFEVAKELVGDNDAEEVFVTLGFNSFADALAIGPISARRNIPILITNRNAKGPMSDDIFYMISELNAKKVTIIGGKNTISDLQEDSLVKAGLEVDRISGSNREETSIEIAEKYLPDSEEIVVANGYESADAVNGGYYADNKNAPIILTSKDNIKDSTYDYINKEKKPTTILGGDKAVSPKVENKINQALNSKITEDEVIDEMIKYQIVEKNDSTKDKGTRTVSVKGINGKKQITNRVEFDGDKIVKITKLSERITVKPINEVVLVGTKEKPVAPEQNTVTRVSAIEDALRKEMSKPQHIHTYQNKYNKGVGVKELNNIFESYAGGKMSTSQFIAKINTLNWVEDYEDGSKWKYEAKATAHQQKFSKGTSHSSIISTMNNALIGRHDYVNVIAYQNTKTGEITVSGTNIGVRPISKVQ